MGVATLINGCGYFQEEQRQLAKRNREELRQLLEDHEEIHSGVRWRRVCDIFDENALWKKVPAEDRKVGLVITSVCGYDEWV